MLVSTVWFWNHGQRAPVVGGVVAGWFGECFGGFGERETPGPIPNPVAKLLSADGTALVGVWESRTPPDFMWGVGGWQVVAAGPRHFFATQKQACAEERGG
jgi:hypothetical protein